MHLLLITNLFPPQELGGYGRCMADFAWGLEQRGHQLSVLCSDAPYLPQPMSDIKLAAPVNRCLTLKGNFRDGVHQLKDAQARGAIDAENQRVLNEQLRRHRFDGVLLGNLDLLGAELLTGLVDSKLPLLHHIGYVMPPFASEAHPRHELYQMVAASRAVRTALEGQGLTQASRIPVVYPGARCDVYQSEARSLPAPLGPELGVPHALGSQGRPLRLCFAGLLMSTKGAHTVAQALALLNSRGHQVELSLAGGAFQEGYSTAIRELLAQQGLSDKVHWFGQLSRPQLARFFRMHHAAVFPSIHPEAFGIVAAEAMASGLILVSSGVGGAAELFEDGISGLGFQAGNPESLASTLVTLIHTPPERLRAMAQSGQQRVREHFSVTTAAAQLEQLFQGWVSPANRLWNRGHITL